MSNILLIDTNKSSVVMTAEIFKEVIPGCSITVTSTGESALDLIDNKTFDMIVVDFDLPDTDGVTFSKVVKKTYHGPVILTAFPDEVVPKAIDADLFSYKDSSMWAKKPVTLDNLAEKIKFFLVKKRRLGRRFAFKTEVTLQIKTKKFKGNLLNMSLGGGLFKLTELPTLKNGEKISVLFDKGFPSPAKGKKPVKAKPGDKTISKLSATVAWIDKKAKTLGLSFATLTEAQQNILEEVLRKFPEVD